MDTRSASPDLIFDYHQRTKHRFERYAAGPASLAWDEQPDPFRRFDGCPQIPLPSPGKSLAARYADLDGGHGVVRQPQSLENLGLLLELSFGLSAWKQYAGERWALRCNPSSGNLHPTEAYVLTTDADLLPPGVYHYLSHDHALQCRARFAAPTTPPGIYLALASVHWREAWKYGERAFRYCQHDVGHALAALRYATAALGWQVEWLAEVGDAELAQLLGIDRHHEFVDGEREAPDLLCRIRIPGYDAGGADLQALLADAKTAAWQGQALPLGAPHREHWPVIETVAAACAKPHSVEPELAQVWQALPATACQLTADALLRQRRSAQRFDAQSVLPQAAFVRLLAATLPHSRIPFDAWRLPPQVHLCVFVHRVAGLAAGLYLLPRSDDALHELRAACRAEFAWEPVWPGQAALPPLYRLVSADCRRAAKTVSCHQDIASDSCFSVALLARFQAPVQSAAWNYRRLFWETGMIGQALYLEAEACGMRGTGIGCFFDDGVHEILGLQGLAFQSLYHFTVGMPVHDARLQTLPAYAHLGGR